VTGARLGYLTAIVAATDLAKGTENSMSKVDNVVKIV